MSAVIISPFLTDHSKCFIRAFKDTYEQNKNQEIKVISNNDQHQQIKTYNKQSTISHQHTHCACNAHGVILALRLTHCDRSARNTAISMAS